MPIKVDAVVIIEKRVRRHLSTLLLLVSLSLSPSRSIYFPAD